MTGMVNTVVEKSYSVHKIPGLADGKSTSIDVEITPSSNLGYRLRDIRVDNDSARVRGWEVLDEPGRYRVHLELAPTVRSSKSAQVDLIYGLDLEDGRYWEARRRVSVNYVPLVELSRKTVYFRRGDPAEGVERSFRLRSSVEEIRFRIRDITFEGLDDDANEIFDIWWETENAGRKYVVHVRRNKKGPGSKTACRLVIHTDNADEPTRVVKVISFN